MPGQLPIGHPLRVIADLLADYPQEIVLALVVSIRYRTTSIDDGSPSGVRTNDRIEQGLAVRASPNRVASLHRPKLKRCLAGGYDLIEGFGLRPIMTEISTRPFFGGLDGSA